MIEENLIVPDKEIKKLYAKFIKESGKKSSKKQYDDFKLGVRYCQMLPFYPSPEFPLCSQLIERMTKIRTRIIGLDFDYNTYTFLLSYLSIKHHFPKELISSISCELSSSRMGYHIIIRLTKSITLLENMMYRGMLGDCSMRLIMSINRLMTGKVGRHRFDLLFTKKGRQKVKKFDMERILKPHKKKIKLIMDNWGNEKMNDEIRAVADDLAEKLPKKKMFTAGFMFNGETTKEIVKRIADSARSKSSMKGERPGFRFKLGKSSVGEVGNLPSYTYYFSVFGRDGKHSTRRAAYMWNNVLKELMGNKDFKEFRDLIGKAPKKVAAILKKYGVSFYWKGKEWTQ